MSETKRFPVEKSDEEWRQLLTPQQYAVLRDHGTEAPGSCALLQEHRPGHVPLRRMPAATVCDRPQIRKRYRLAEFL